MTVPTAAEWREAVVPAVLKFMARCYDAGYKDALDAEPEARRWNALLKEGEGDNDILAALRPLIERLERELDASTVRLRAADSLADAVAAHVTSGLLGERSVAADALLDYRDPPRTPRSDALAAATEAAALWEAEAGRLRKTLGVTRSHLAELHVNWSEYSGDPSVSHLCHRLAFGGDYIANALASPRPAPGAVVALVEEWRELSAELTEMGSTGDGYVSDCATALARALGMEEGP